MVSLLQLFAPLYRFLFSLVTFLSVPGLPQFKYNVRFEFVGGSGGQYLSCLVFSKLLDPWFDV